MKEVGTGHSARDQQRPDPTVHGLPPVPQFEVRVTGNKRLAGGHARFTFWRSPTTRMQIINEAQVPTEHRVSPKGVFEVVRKHMSLALGGVKDKGPWGGGHPFDIELATIPPGKRNYPLHAHAAQTEYYIIVRGRGVFIDSTGAERPVTAGDHVIVHPGEAHQIRSGEEPLTYFVVADHHPADVTTYPKTGKRQIKPEYRVVSLQDADYYADEE